MGQYWAIFWLAEAEKSRFANLCIGERSTILMHIRASLIGANQVIRIKLWGDIGPYPCRRVGRPPS
jgi:hypothetical protein